MSKEKETLIIAAKKMAAIVKAVKEVQRIVKEEAEAEEEGEKE